MTNAPTDVAKRGFEIYRAMDPRPTFDELNCVLRDEGLVEVADRMYRHYKRMDGHGQAIYVPINEFDIRMKLRAAAAAREEPH